MSWNECAQTSTTSSQAPPQPTCVTAPTGPGGPPVRCCGTWRLASSSCIGCLPLVRLLGRLPAAFSRTFAVVLTAATRPFHVINYLGSVGGALVFHGPRLTRQFDRTIDRLQRHLDEETEEALARRMHFPHQS